MRIAGVACCAALMLRSSQAIPETSDSADPMIPMPHIVRAFFALSVKDVDTMAGWYSRYLGFQVDRRGSTNGTRFAILSGEQGLLEMVEFPKARSRAGWGLGKLESHEIQGIFKIGFEVRDLQQAFDRATAQRATVFFPIVQARDVPLRTFGLKDPEGNIVQFFGK